MKKDFLTEFNRVKQSIENGVTPVFSEIRNAKTSLKELFPLLIIQSVLLIISTSIVNLFNVSEIVMLVILLVSNTTTSTLSNMFLVLIKHQLRIRKLKKFNLEVTEENIAVLESMEYQSV